MSKEILPPEKMVLHSNSFDGKHKLEFKESSHRYKLDGEHCVGTTTFIKAALPTSQGLSNWKTDQAVMFALSAPDSLDGIELIKTARDAWKEVSQEAADVGTVTHSYAELMSTGKIAEAERLLNQLKYAPKWPIIKSCINKYTEWAKDNVGELIATENLIASPTYMFSGKFDRLDNIKGKIRLRDYKTSKSFYSDQFVQLAAYAIALKEWNNIVVNELEVIRFGKDDGKFETLLIDDPKEILMFKEWAILLRREFDLLKMNNDPRFDWKK